MNWSRSNSQQAMARLFVEHDISKMYRKFPNKGAGRWGNTLGGAPIREQTFPASSGFLQNDDGCDMAKNVQNLSRLGVKTGGGGALIGGGALNGEFAVYDALK